MSIPESHLAQEAIAALVDGELPAGPASRAARHLSGCLQCRLAVEAQREAKEALHRCADVDVPGDLLSRLRAIPFTADVPGDDGGAILAAGPENLTLSGPRGSWAVPLHAPHRPDRPGHARWLRRGVAGTLGAVGLGAVALALATLPSGNSAAPGDPGPQEHTRIVPPVVRAITVGTTGTLPGPGASTSPPAAAPSRAVPIGSPAASLAGGRP